MIPIKDLNPTKTFPFLTIILILMNVYVFAMQSTLRDMHQEFFYFNHGIIPKCFLSMHDKARYEEAISETKGNLKKIIAQNVQVQTRMRLTRRDIQYIDSFVEAHFHRANFGIKNSFFNEILTLFTSMFMHGGIAHLIGNMWFLWIFGNNIEEVGGKIKFIIFYLLCGIFASFGHILMNTQSLIPTIGASGAISGVLGAYLLMYPTARILTFIPIGYFLWLEELPAYIFLGYWILIQIILGVFRDPLLGGGVAWFAHIAGFFAGVILVLIFERKKIPFLNTAGVTDMKEEEM